MSDLIVLIDGNALVHRAFHALPALHSPTGELTNATYGFTSMLLKVWRELAPRYIVAAFDSRGPTFRRQEFEAYKATRGPAPEGLSHQFGRVFQILEAFNIPIYQLQGYEADDLLGALALQAVKSGLKVVILTGDLDALQLVQPDVQVLAPQRGFTDTRLYDEAAVLERYGLRPPQLVDLRALRGDVSDNIPGVPGIGEKTATKLLSEYGTVENLLANLDRLPARVREALGPYQEQVLLAKRLARIETDLPVDLDLSQADLKSYDRQRVLEIFRELGFRSLVDRLPEPGAPTRNGARDGRVYQPDLFSSPVASSGQTSGHEETSRSHPPGLVVTDEDLARLATALREAGSFALGVHTQDKGPMRGELVGLSFAVGSGSSYIPVGHRISPSQPSWERVRAEIGPLLEDEQLAKSAHGAKAQMVSLERYGVRVRGLQFDTEIAAYLTEKTPRDVGLTDLAWSYLQQDLPAGPPLKSAGRKTALLTELPLDAVAEHYRREVDVVYRLVPLLARGLEESGLQQLFREVELPLVSVLAAMERVGVAVDADYLRDLSRELYGKVTELEREIFRHVGHQFNLNSPKQLSSVLFEELRLGARVRRTKTGQVSTRAAVLEELRGTHPVVDLILEHRQVQKLKSTYVDALPLLVNTETGRVHTSFNQTVTTTGRLSSSDPNLQNIPARTELGRRVRRAFVAGHPGWKLLSADYSQIELRILAHVTQDPTLMEAFARGDDIHAATAAEVMGLDIGQVTAEQRRLAKVVNFGVLYGMTEYGLAARTDLPETEAAAFIQRYFSRFGTVKQYQERVLQEAARTGYVCSLLGRRRYLPALQSGDFAARQEAAREAVNMPIQGTAADIIKIAMVRLHRAMEQRRLAARMILQVHDELVFELPEEELTTVAPLVRQMMESAMEMVVPLKVELKVGDNWDEMHPL